MDEVVLKRGSAKPLWHGHPWVHARSVARDAHDAEADWVRVLDADGRVVGRGLRSATSAIRVRLLERGEGDRPLEALLEERIAAAVLLRRRLLDRAPDTDVYRLVHAEGDDLPGLVVDRLGDVLVAQLATRPIHRRRELIASMLLAATGARSLVARPAGHEAREGIAPDATPFVVGDPPPERVVVSEGGVLYETVPLRGQKTGHFADQRENRALVAAVADGLEVLDVYSGTGGFALAALRAGAAGALLVDASRLACSLAAANAERNGVADRVAIERADAGEVLRALRDARRTFGLVVLDPPNLLPRRGPERGALKALRELQVRALTRVAPGGFLATFSCSPRLDGARLLDVLSSAARDCRRPFRVLRTLEAGPDHPIAPAAPFSRYLSGLLVQA